MNKPLVVHVVDDDKAVLESCLFGLEVVGFNAKGYCDAEDFLAAEGHEHGLLISDIRMPGMSGIDLTQHLRDRGMTLPIILMTGHGDADTLAFAMRAGADAFMTKPVDLEMLVAKITALVADRA